MAGSGATLTYRQLDEGANRVSRLMASHGLKPGDHVALCLENHPRFFELVWGCHYAGLVYTCCSSRLTTDELAYIINDCGAKVFVASKYKADQADEVVSLTPNVIARYMLDGTTSNYDSYEQAVSAQSSEPLPERFEGTDMLYSSGTTGRPKGVMLTNSNFFALIPFAQQMWKFDDNTVNLVAMPLFHIGGGGWATAGQALGAKSIVVRDINPVELVQLFSKHRITHGFVVPALLQFMLMV
ncbi:MAG: acyl-CoA synthetase, partial [Acidimicrobiia bacterium]|nr:acyl-CoA synthetase [Acidimicrobiia bacterium]